MTLRIPDWLIDAETVPWQTRLVFAAINGPDKAEGRIPLRVLARQTKLSISLTIRPALDALEAAGWIERTRGHSTGTENPDGKRLATGRLLSVHPALTEGSFTVIGADRYEQHSTALGRWNELRSASRERREKGLVTIRTDTEVDLVLDLQALASKKEILPLEPVNAFSITRGPASSRDPAQLMEVFSEEEREELSSILTPDTGQLKSKGAGAGESSADDASLSPRAEASADTDRRIPA